MAGDTQHHPQRDAVKRYIDALEAKYEDRYRRSAGRHRAGTLGLQIMALGFTTATSILTGIYHVEGCPGVLTVVFPALATFLLAVRTSLRFPDIWRLREEAEIEFRGLVTRGRQRLLADESEDACGKLHRELEQWARKLERQAMISAIGSIPSEPDSPKSGH